MLPQLAVHAAAMQPNPLHHSSGVQTLPHQNIPNYPGTLPDEHSNPQTPQGLPGTLGTQPSHPGLVMQQLQQQALIQNLLSQQVTPGTNVAGTGPSPLAVGQQSIPMPHAQVIHPTTQPGLAHHASWPTNLSAVGSHAPGFQRGQSLGHEHMMPYHQATQIQPGVAQFLQHQQPSGTSLNT